MRATQRRCPPSPHASLRLEPSRLKQKSIPVNATRWPRFPFLRTKYVRCEDMNQHLCHSCSLAECIFSFECWHPNISLLYSSSIKFCSLCTTDTVKATEQHLNMQCGGPNYKTANYLLKKWFTTKAKSQLRDDVLSNRIFIFI